METFVRGGEFKPQQPATQQPTVADTQKHQIYSPELGLKTMTTVPVEEAVHMIPAKAPLWAITPFRKGVFEGLKLDLPSNSNVCELTRRQYTVRDLIWSSVGFDKLLELPGACSGTLLRMKITADDIQNNLSWMSVESFGKLLSAPKSTASENRALIMMLPWDFVASFASANPLAMTELGIPFMDIVMLRGRSKIIKESISAEVQRQIWGVNVIPGLLNCSTPAS